MKIPRRRCSEVQIDLSPLIDCVFQLLIFFMLSSTLLVPSIGLSLPTASAAATQTPKLVVTADKDGQFFLNSQPVPTDQLKARLQQLVEQTQPESVAYAGDSGAKHEDFVRVLDILKACGIDSVDVMHTPR